MSQLTVENDLQNDVIYFLISYLYVSMVIK